MATRCLFPKPSFRFCSWTRDFHATGLLSRRFGAGEKRGKAVETWSPELFSEGIKALPQGFRQLKKEFLAKFHDPMFILHPNDSEMLWRFDDARCQEDWTASADSDNDEGYSTCEFVRSPQGRMLFQGNLNTEVPKDGKLKRTGYVNLRSKRAQKSFGRNDYWDWQVYSHLCLLLRGDGRSYTINLHVPGVYDVSWDDTYHYVLYTRGGPYWQWTRIPFSKFLLGARGRVQDRQFPIPLWKISCLSFTLSDGNSGPFQLELDHIALQWDPSHTEEFAYEQYKIPKHIADV